MGDLEHVGSWLEEQVPQLLEKYDVPAAAWAVLHDGQVVDGASGLLSKSTGVEATADSVFQIGSVTKLWTASLVMQLVDEGEVELDAPVRTYLPEFRIADEAAAAVITVRQLLSHTAGFEGDIFTDTGFGDDCVEKYVATLGDVAQLFPPGERFSYNNAGYCVLGRLVEVVRGTTYDAALREHLIGPLGLTHTATNAYEAILFRAAVGHMEQEPGGGQQPAPVWAMARSNAPAGSMLTMRARDLLAFARMHLEDGTAADGTRVLAPGTSARMQEQQVTLPPIGMMGSSWGLGFERFDDASSAVVGHDGNTIGQAAFCRMVPEHGLAVVLLSNGGDAFSLYRDVVGHVLEELGGVQTKALPTPPAHPEPVDASRYVGTYSAEVYDLNVSQDDEGRVWIETVPKGFLAELGEETSTVELVGYGDDMLIPLQPDRGMHMPHAFLGDDGEGRSRYLFLGRIVRRAGV
ncbi:beta-lactamase family protein [Nocardioides anomalus]|uniref:Beta-lactamase family protein n=1 Tax=Nocardioides anomalus TaxID=2712223 RepID=A0A6G6WCH1_9ACTN|nr:serine hydrolase domain-containing protein [Nocardioides anomalus]QIG42942.1 beta-lactamase family protein [Nocardioides anomalus]